MGFLAPIYLALGAAAAVPLLVHLLRRRSGARVDFPAVRYLARAEQEHSRQLRLRNLLLMLLRVATVAVVALAAARPLSGAIGSLFGGPHAPVALAIVVDNSLSTSVIQGGHPALDEIKAVAHAAADRAGAGDRLWLVTADGRVQGGTARSMVEAIDHIAPLAGAGDVPHAVVTAASLVHASGIPNAVVAIVTDGQRSTWADTSGAALDVENGARLVVYTLSSTPPANHAVTDVAVRPTHWTPRGEITATVLGAVDSTAYRITLNGHTLARGTVTNGEIAVHAVPSDRGWVAGTVELEPDELRGDDIRHFAVSITNPPVVSVDSGVGPFTASAIDALVEGGDATRTGTGPRVTVASADQTASLPAVMMAPLDPVHLGAANRALERLGVPWRYGDVQHGDTPLDSATDLSRAAPPLATAQTWYPLVPAGAATTSGDTLVRLSGARTPWAVAGPGYVLLASPLDPRATTLPLRAGFVPWLANLLTQQVRSGPGGGGGAHAVISAAPGATVRRPDWAQEIENPDGSHRPIVGPTVEAPAQTGVYFLRRAGGDRVGALVVNGEARESDLTRLSAAELSRAIRAPHVAVLTDQARWAAAVFDASAGRPIAGPLLVCALSLLLLEAIILRRGTSSSSRRDRTPARVHATDQHPSRAA